MTEEKLQKNTQGKGKYSVVNFNNKIDKDELLFAFKGKYE